MIPTPSTYQSLISPRSRRLRTVGMVLLAAVLVMAIYGAFFLMPALRKSLAAQLNSTQTADHSINRTSNAPQHTGNISASNGTLAQTSIHNSTRIASASTAAERRAKRAALVKVTFAYAYWTVCALLVVAALLIAWLDLREVRRNFESHRRALWAEAANEQQRRSRDG